MTAESNHTASLEPGWPGRARAQAERLRDLYAALDGLAERQMELIERDELDTLIDLLTERGGIVQQIESIAGQLRPISDAWQRLGASVPEPERSALDAALGQIESLSARILERDEADAARLGERRSAVALEMASMGRKRAAVNAYSGGGGPRHAPRFQDREV